VSIYIKEFVDASGNELYDLSTLAFYVTANTLWIWLSLIFSLLWRI